MNRVEKAEKLLIRCEKDLEKLIKFEKDLIRMEKNRAELLQYYDEFFMEDYLEYEDKPFRPNVLDQDSIWNVLTGIYQQKIVLLKYLINNL